jgi:hypothetical protein
MIGHIFGTGGYDTSGVSMAQQELMRRYGDCLDDVHAQFPEWETIKLKSAAQPGKPGDPDREVQVRRVDEIVSKDHQTGKPIRRKKITHIYVWVASEHPGEEEWSDQQIEETYRNQAVKIREEIEYITESEVMEST